jgi:hypothetical protein
MFSIAFFTLAWVPTASASGFLEHYIEMANSYAAQAKAIGEIYADQYKDLGELYADCYAEIGNEYASFYKQEGAQIAQEYKRFGKDLAARYVSEARAWAQEYSIARAQTAKPFRSHRWKQGQCTQVPR